ncbi:MAG: methylated-DNA--[protein]-cysteine S-methyltransferase [Chitinophagaceae bacterium]
MSLFSAIYNSPLGAIGIQASETHIHRVTFLEEERISIRNNGLTDLCCEALSLYFEGKQNHFPFQYHLEGTLFQNRVWELLQNIPYGTQITYAALSKQIGNPKAIRAVGTANGKNPIAILIPCHRVVGSQGKLTGYAGRLERKAFLLALEQKNSHQRLF